MAQFSTQRTSGAASAATIHTKAPGGLRRRVLGSVHHDTGRRQRRKSRVAVALAGSMLVLALILFAVRGGGAGHVYPAKVELNTPTPRASLRRIGDRGELTMSGMSDPPAGETYEVWLDRPGKAPQPTDALFTVTRSGNATVDIPGRLHGLRAVLVTAEPLGGSVSPTHSPIVSVALGG